MFFKERDLAPSMDDLVNALMREAPILGNRFEGFTSRIARTKQTVALGEGYMFVCDRGLGEGDISVE